MIKEKPGTRIRFDYEITNQDGLLIHTGYTVLVFVSAETRKVVPFPEVVKTALESFF
jgi:acyl-CoA thioester hydrolase